MGSAVGAIMYGSIDGAIMGSADIIGSALIIGMGMGMGIARAAAAAERKIITESFMVVERGLYCAEFERVGRLFYILFTSKYSCTVLRRNKG